jgi:Lipase (class 3)
MYDDRQTLFRLAMSSQVGASLSGNLQYLASQTAGALKTELDRAAPEMGDWKIVWGPAVYSAPGSRRPDNAMFAAERNSGSGSPRWIVLSIAGTNPASLFDQLFENACIFPLHSWPCRNPALKPKVAHGSFAGFNILKKMTSGHFNAGGDLSFREFMIRNARVPARLTITAHSLGSALASLLALWLFETQREWDPEGHITIDCFPFAAPTSGNRDFSTYYTNSDLGRRSNRCDHRLDAVPHAWKAEDLKQIPVLYSPHIEVGFLKPVVFGISLLAAKAGFEHVLPLAEPLSGGAFNPDRFDPKRTAIQNFVDQWNYQHVGAYFDLLKIGTEADELRRKLEGRAPRSTGVA